jgi:hypothetical protein
MTHFQVNSPNVIHEIIDGEAVLVNLETGSYYSIDSVGAVVWNYIEKGLSSDQIIEAIVAQYDGKPADIAKDVQQLLEDLKAEFLLVVAEDIAVPGVEPVMMDVSEEQAKQPFKTPVLHKYTDMEDLLMLDPIHDVDESGWPNTNPNNAE